jgi:hypothetical protein
MDYIFSDIGLKHVKLDIVDMSAYLCTCNNWLRNLCTVLSHPSSPQSEKLVLYIPLPTIVVIGLQKPYTKK